MGILDSLKNMFRSSGKGGAKKKKKLPIIDVEKRFELLGRTGQGSMSKVYRARDKSSGKMVCLKVLDRVKTERFESRFQGLNRPIEGEICESLRHKNIVQTFEYGMTKDKEQYIVMELVDGMGLNFLIENNSTSLIGNRIEFLIQLAQGIEFVHRQGYLHRDICPRNVMVSNEGVVKIIDFGLAIPLTPDFCKPGNRTGTTNYMAPELIKRQATDQRVDLFALGVTCYETITREMPWERADTETLLRQMMNTPPRDPQELAPGLPDEVAKFLLKATKRNPDDRFQTATAFKEALLELPAGW